MYTKLLRIFFNESFSMKRLFGFDVKKNKTKTFWIGLAIVYALVSYIFGIGYLFFDLAKTLNEIGQVQVILGFAITYALGLGIMMALFRSNGYIFHYKDYDILAPLPIKDETVLFAKISVMLIISYITDFIFLLPIAFSYFYFAGVTFLGLIYFIIGFLLSPIIPIIVLSFLSLLITEITARLPFAKLMNLLLMFALFIGIFILSFSFNETTVNPLTGQIDVIKGLGDVYPPVRWFSESVHDGNLLSLFYNVILSVGLFLVYLFGIRGLVKHTNQNKTKQYIHKNKNQKIETSNLLQTLVTKEAKKYFSLTYYVLNTGLGPVIILIMSIASIFFKNDIIPVLEEMTAANLDPELLILIIFGFSISMTYTSAISLSLEGKNLWIIKSLPIDPFTIMLSKVIFNIILIVPVTIIGLSILIFTLSLSITTVFPMMILLVGLGILMSLLDGIINLYMPKFEFSNEIEVIKQSISALVAIFGAFAILISLGVMYYFISGWIGMLPTLYLLGILTASLSYILYIGLKPIARKQFQTF